MFEWITGVIAELGYLGVAALTFLENLLPPIPSELVIPLAGFVAAQGDMRLSLAISAAIIGSLGGAIFWYAIARRVGERRVRAWVDRNGKWLTLTGDDIDSAVAWFHRHGKTAVLIGRLVPGVRTFVSLPAGFARMPLPSFLVFSTIGTTIWTVALAYAGVALQSQFTLVSDYINAITNGLLIVLAIIVIRRYVRCWRGRRGQALS